MYNTFPTLQLRPICEQIYLATDQPIVLTVGTRTYKSRCNVFAKDINSHEFAVQMTLIRIA